MEQILHNLSNVRDKIDKVLSIIVKYLMVALLCTVLVQIFYRYVVIHFLQFNLSFTDELSRYLMLWITYLSVGIIYKEGLQSSVDIILRKIHVKARFILILCINLAILIFLFLVITHGLPFALSTYRFRTPTMQLPQVYLYMAPVIGSCLLFFQVFILTLDLLVYKAASIEIRKLGES